MTDRNGSNRHSCNWIVRWSYVPVGSGDLARIAAAATKIGQAVGTRVLAEGVETDAAAAAVIKAGVDLLQGFRYARPLPLQELRQRIAIDGTLLPVDSSAIPRQPEMVVAPKLGGTRDYRSSGANG